MIAGESSQSDAFVGPQQRMQGADMLHPDGGYLCRSRMPVLDQSAGFKM